IVPPQPTHAEKLYLAGIIGGLRADPPAGEVPVVPADAPLAPDIRTWVSGLLAGMYSRRALPADATAPVDRADDVGSV
ncbi:hypothetical protein G3I15_16385, partial [Streptomyces sp. SID10244]|nr:hypothetical protein [Streptomyces sp. SID10244]